MRKKLAGGWWFNTSFWQKGISFGWDDIHCEDRPEGDFCSYGLRLARGRGES